MSEVECMFEREGGVMSASALAMPTPPPTFARPHAVRLAAAATGLWRVVDGVGRVIGHIQTLTSDGETRFRARRFHAPTRGFRDLGDFWSADDAIDCLVFSR